MKMFGRREGKLDLNQILMLICLTILIITVAMPMIMIVYNTFFYGFTFDWSMFTNVVMDPSNVDAMWNTIVIAFWVTVVGTIVGVFYAWLIGRTNI
ncbi:MAG TPA: hypothetical protein PK849_09110, partial [Synergistales bacterium]|nr:hypothetical protein [Synergistales bacterium]